MSSQEPITKKFKKSTARFVRGEITKTQQSLAGRASNIGLQLGVLVVLGLIISFGYVQWIM